MASRIMAAAALLLIAPRAFAQVETGHWDYQQQRQFDQQMQQQMQQEQQMQQMLNEIRSLPTQEQLEQQRQQQMQQQIQQMQQQQQQVFIAQIQQYGASHPQQHASQVQVPAPLAGKITGAQWHGYLLHVFDKFYAQQYPGFPASITSDTAVTNAIAAHVVSDALAKAAIHREITGQALKDLHALRNQLLGDTKYHSGQGALAVGVIAKGINEFSNLLLSTLLITEAGESGPAIKQALEKSHALPAYETLNAALIDGRFDREFLERTYAEAALADARPDLPVLIELAMEFKGFAEGLIAVGELAEDQKSLNAEVARQLDRIDREIDRYNQRMRQLEKQGGGPLMHDIRTDANMRIEDYLLSARIYQKTRDAAVAQTEAKALK